MYDGLIKALRDMSKMGMKYGMAVVKMREAADAIEELQKRVPKRPHGRLVDAGRLLSEQMKQKYYHLPNGDTAIPIIDVEHAPAVIEAEEGE